MEETGTMFDGPVTIDHHVHYVASSGKCRPDEGHTIWQLNCQHDEDMKMPGTWHRPEME